MSRQKWIIFLILTSNIFVYGQIEDDFSPALDEIDPAWVGDRSDFVINSEAQLQLSASEAGTSMLWREFKWDSKQSWEVDVFLDFNPSANNRLEIYLWSNSLQLSESSGVFLSIGENGNEDAIHLWQQENGAATIIASGSPGLVAFDPVDIRIRAQFEEGFITLSVATNKSLCFVEEFSLPVDIPVLNSPLFFGLSCTYTNTRRDLFRFDNIYVGEQKEDVIPPAITNVGISENEITCSFSELVDDSADTEISLNPDPGDLNIQLSKDGLTCSSDTGFEAGNTYSLYVNNLTDIAGNALDTMIQVTLHPHPVPGDLLLNEILFNPRGSGSDFVELINVSGQTLDLNGLTLSNRINGDSLMVTGDLLLEDEGLVVFTPDKPGITTDYPSHDSDRIIEQEIPRMNNDDGNIAISFMGATIDEFDYEEDFHHPLLDDVDGVSLERISINEPTQSQNNWTSALEGSSFATPGLTNSTVGKSFAEQSNFSIENKVFSPDGDGFRDEVMIHYDLDAPEYVGTVRVFSDRGRLTRTVAVNQIWAQSGTINWDGLTDNGGMAPTGIYIIMIEGFSVEGAQFKKRFSCGLGKNLE